MDLLLRGATVIDGTGGAARRADVAVNRGIITDVGDLAAGGAQADEVVDLGGRVLAPGFIDVHTHYDAQVIWDRDLTPSCWHGVTTVIMGNCGFGIAPTRPADRRTIIETLENVEGMSAEALEAGLDWTFETFPEYLDTLRREATRLNVGVMVGHTPLRTYVLGADAVRRTASAVEIDVMRGLVADALDAGAVGFASSKTPVHIGAAGAPVPSRLAELEEVTGIAAALRAAGRGILQASAGPGLYVKEFAGLSEATERPLSWTALLAGGDGPPAMKALEKQSQLGGEVWPQIACRPIVTQITLENPFAFAAVPAFGDVLKVPHEERQALYGTQAWRDRARGELDASWNPFWTKVTVQESQVHPDLCAGPHLGALAEARGIHPLDLLLDIALSEDLTTRFQVILANDDEQEIGELLRDDRTILGLSDAGAHASQLCDAGFATYLLQHWVRETGTLTLEKAIWRLTGQPAEVFRLADRGRIAPGFAADLVTFDPATVGVGPLRRVWDLPSGADRLVVDSIGVDAIWVNGHAIRRDGADITGARPGVMVRSGA